MEGLQGIEHAYLSIDGLNLHIARAGKGELGTVVFLHGFPEIWYTWRHQMLAVAAAGYCAIAPDFRGYGLSDQPPAEAPASLEDLTADLLGIIDALAIPKVFLVGKDFGVFVAYDFAFKHPDRLRGVICLGIPFMPRLISSGDSLPEGFYILRWQQPGRAEADFARFDVRRIIRTVYILFSRSEIPTAGKDQEIMDLADLSTPLPEWFTEEDLDIYAALYEKSGFAYPLKMPYRALPTINYDDDEKIKVPVLLAMGEEDYVYKFPGVEPAVKGGMRKYVPDLRVVDIPGGSHFVHEQFPAIVNDLILQFLKEQAA